MMERRLAMRQIFAAADDKRAEELADEIEKTEGTPDGSEEEGFDFDEDLDGLGEGEGEGDFTEDDFEGEDAPAAEGEELPEGEEDKGEGDDLTAGETCPECGAELDSAEPVINLTDLSEKADEDGNIKASDIKDMLAAVALPDDKGEDAIVSGRKVKADCNRPGPEDKIGDQAGGATPSVSKAVDEEAQDVSTIKKITARIDRVASYVQRLGCVKLARHLDMLSNTIESR